MRISDKTIATRALLIKLIERGWNFKRLAEECGVDHRHIENCVSSNFTQEIRDQKTKKVLKTVGLYRIRLLVEKVLGTPIFSSAEEFNRAAAQTKLFGFDPRLDKIGQLRALAAEHGISVPTNFRKQSLIETIAAQLAVQKKSKSNPKKHYG